MAYAEVSVVVDGAEEDFETYHDETLLWAFIASIEEEAAGHGYPTEVYVLWHDHEDLTEDEECACSQYVTDHHPQYAWNMADES